ncbi:uncharacterized protein PAC_02910 [Phialocephala subalpina]|uniref:Uncharacterized protein n=1 Tax=Phialocephala subalpina TaxID=576137 RepID=A0A1L7WJT1_9HELO|nr:uncharacterized protein PAC_02910 [Phialocephala subalpina]
MRPRTAVSGHPLPASNTYRSRQTQSGNSPSTQRLFSSDLPDSSPKSLKSEQDSIRATHKISFNLVSLVTKFEALDALSLPLKVRSLQAAPLQVSPRLRRRGGGKATGRLRRLSTIFSPSRSSGGNDDPFFSETDPYSGRENIFSSSNVKVTTSFSKAGTKKLRKVQSTHNGNSIRKWGRGSKTVQESPASVVTAPYVKNEFPVKNKPSIRDMIKLYDGAISHGSITKWKPSTAGPSTPNTPTPTSRRRPGEKGYHLSPSTGNVSMKSSHWQSKEPESPTRSRQTSSKRSLLPESATANLFNDQNSPSKSSVNSLHVSPRTIDRARYDGDKQNTQTYCAPSCGKREGIVRLSPYECSAVKTTTSQEMKRGRSLLRNKASATCDRRDISNKIELLYRAKSLERKQEDNKVPNPRASVLTTTGGNRHNVGNVPADSDFGRYLRKKSSKVAAMTKLFDNGYAPKPAVMVAPVLRSKPIFSASSPFVERDRMSVERVFPSQPTPPLMGQSIVKRKSTISPKTVQDVTIVQVKTNPPAKSKTDVLPQPRSLQKLSQPKGRSINEKVRLFESVRDSKEAIPERKRSVFARKLSRSLKSLFEPHPSRRTEYEKRIGHRRGLDGSDVKFIVEESQRSTDTLGKFGKRTNTLLGRWNAIPPASVTRGVDGALSENGIGSPSAAEVQEMIFKEAECGLKEPKPVRVAEVKRMMLICKERFGDMIA